MSYAEENKTEKEFQIAVNLSSSYLFLPNFPNLVNILTQNYTSFADFWDLPTYVTFVRNMGGFEMSRWQLEDQGFAALNAEFIQLAKDMDSHWDEDHQRWQDMLEKENMEGRYVAMKERILKHSFKYMTTKAWKRGDYLKTVQEYSTPKGYFNHSQWMKYQNRWAKKWGSKAYRHMNHFRLAAQGREKPPVVRKDAPHAEFHGFKAVGSSYKATSKHGKDWVQWIQDEFEFKLDPGGFKMSDVDTYIKERLYPKLKELQLWPSDIVHAIRKGHSLSGVATAGSTRASNS
jgi:hypothetical protein